MPTCTLKDLLESKDGVGAWAPIVATVTKAPQTAKSSPGARGAMWTRLSLTIAAEGVSAALIWTDPVQPFLDNPKLLEGKSILLEPGVTIETYGDARRIRAKANEVQTSASAPSGAPAPTSAPQGASYAPPPPAQAHPLMAPAPGLTDRALLQAYAAWAPKLWAILNPGLQAAPGTAQAVSSCLNSMLIAATQGKLAVTLYAEDEPSFNGDFDA